MILGSLISLALMASAAAPETPRRRFALVVGANNGGPNKLLRHAIGDAVAFSKVMESLGGVLPADGIVLKDPGIDALRAALRLA